MDRNTASPGTAPLVVASRGLLLLGTALASFARVQAAPEWPIPGHDAGAAIEAARPPAPAPAEALPPVGAPPARPPPAPEAAGTLRVKRIVVVGGERARTSAPARELAAFEDRELTMAEIAEVADRVTQYYRGQGFLLASAYVPKQDASAGTLEIQVVLGEYGRFTFHNRSLVRDDLVEGPFEGMRGKPVTRESLERAMLLVRDLPGGGLPTLTIAPGAGAGTSDFTVEVARPHRLGGYVMADNQGSKYTGTGRLYAGVGVNSPFRDADKLSVSGMVSDNGQLWNGRVAYSFPLRSDGLRAEASASRTTYELGGVYRVLQATGTADAVDAVFSYPVVRSSRGSADLSLDLTYKNLEDKLGAVGVKIPRTAEVAALILAGDRQGSLLGLPLATSASVSLTGGNLDIDDAEQKALNEAGRNTTGAYAKADASFSEELGLTRKLSARVTVRGQWAITAKDLDSSEQLLVSGARGVKSCAEGLGGDEGYVAGAELRYALPAVWKLNHAVSAFADQAWVQSRKAEGHVRMADVGLGYSLGLGHFFASAQAAYTLGARPLGSETRTDARVLLATGMAL